MKHNKISSFQIQILRKDFLQGYIVKTNSFVSIHERNYIKISCKNNKKLLENVQQVKQRGKTSMHNEMCMLGES